MRYNSLLVINNNNNSINNYYLNFYPRIISISTKISNQISKVSNFNNYSLQFGLKV